MESPLPGNNWRPRPINFFTMKRLKDPKVIGGLAGAVLLALAAFFGADVMDSACDCQCEAE